MTSNPRKILVVSAHPDDEILGCGGTICHHVARGDAVSVLFLSEGVSSRGEFTRGWSREIEERERFAAEAARLLNWKVVKFLRHPNLRMKDLSILDIVKEVLDVIHDVQPDTVYTHASGDLNSDHRVAYEAVVTACRPAGPMSVKNIYAFEVPSSTEWSSTGLGEYFIPTRFVDIDPYLQKKLDGLVCYDHEMRPFPHPRSPENITALARYRGMAVGLKAAEAFVVVREVVDS